jgi:hypothetical protein
MLKNDKKIKWQANELNNLVFIQTYPFDKEIKKEIEMKAVKEKEKEIKKE